MKKCLVVEDSSLARREILRMLKQMGIFEEILEAANVRIAHELMNKHSIDLVFLDIHLPGKNGFEFLESLDDLPAVIFTTAYDEYAIKSFEYNTIDYLLKPIKKERLEKAIAKMAFRVDPKSSSSQGKMFVRDGEKCWFVNISKIRLIESYGNYSKLFFEDNNPLISKSLNALEETLDKKLFFRANRKQIINLDYINRIEDLSNEKLILILTSGEEIEVSRRKSSEFKNLFRN